MEGGERSHAVPGVLESANGGSGLAHVPKRYVVPSSHRPNLSPETADVPIIGLSELKESPAQRSPAVELKPLDMLVVALEFSTLVFSSKLSPSSLMNGNGPTSKKCRQKKKRISSMA